MVLLAVHETVREQSDWSRHRSPDWIPMPRARQDRTHKVEEREHWRANARAVCEYRADSKRQMHDTVGDGDIRYLVNRTPKTDELKRLDEQQAFVNPAGVAWGSRKADRSCRDMTEGNPWVQIVMRKALRSTCCWLAENQSPYSNANRVEFRKPQGTWAQVAYTAPYKSAFPHHRSQLMKMARGHRTGILADARRLYPSIQPALIYHRMRQLGVSTNDARIVRVCLERMCADTGIPGLPISDQTSGWLSELAMHKVHQRLEAVPGLEFTIWSDDLYVGDGASVIADMGLAAYQTALKEIGTFVASEKTQRSWVLNITPLEMVRDHWSSHGDLLFFELGGNSVQHAGKLLDVLRESASNIQLLKSLLTLTADKPDVPPQLAQQIVCELLANPLVWEQCCPQAGAFLRFHATPSERAQALNVARDLRSEGMVGSEQRVALFRLIGEPPSLPLADCGPAARDLLAHSRQADAVPERQWARVAAYLIDPFTIRRTTIDSGEFHDLHPFEQRTAIAFAEPRQHCWWLERQRNSGRWPTAAEARMKGQLKVNNR